MTGQKGLTSAWPVELAEEDRDWERERDTEEVLRDLVEPEVPLALPEDPEDVEEEVECSEGAVTLREEIGGSFFLAA
jgi:hypothetical protein